METPTSTGKTLLVGTGAFLATVWILRKMRAKRYSMPPGPRQLPVVGNLLSFDESNPFGFFDDCRKKYGDIYTIKLGANTTVVLCNEELVRQSFVKRQNETSGRPSFYSFEIMTDNKDIVFGQPNDKVWKMQHKIFHGAIRKFAAGSNLERLVHGSLANLKVYFNTAMKENSFNPRYCTNLLIFNINAAMSFGKTYDHDDPFFKEFVETMTTLFDDIGAGLMADFFPILKHFPSQQVTKLKRFMGMYHKYINETIDEHRQNFDPKNIRDFTDQLIQIQEEVKNSEEAGVLGQMTQQHFVGLLGDLFFAGTDTTRITLWWFILFMAKYPEIQETMQKEIDSVVGRDSLVVLSDRHSLPYTEACIYEVMRIRPVVPLSVPHEATEDSAVGEFTFPKGTQIIAYTLAIHHDPSNWPEPEKFDPTRFLDESGGLRPRSELAWMPFSVGKRACVGEALARSSLHLITAALFQKFTFKGEPGKEINTEPKFEALGMLPRDQDLIVEQRW